MRASTKAQHRHNIDKRATTNGCYFVSAGRLILLEYILSEFNWEPGRGYSTMNTIQSAISAIATIADRPAGQHPLVSWFMKAVFLQRPSFSRTHVTWDPQLVLDYICSLGFTEALSLLHLSRKLVILMLLLSGQRSQT